MPLIDLDETGVFLAQVRDDLRYKPAQSDRPMSGLATLAAVKIAGILCFASSISKAKMALSVVRQAFSERFSQ
jgi:hypothetical protein